MSPVARSRWLRDVGGHIGPVSVLADAGMREADAARAQLEQLRALLAIQHPALALGVGAGPSSVLSVLLVEVRLVAAECRLADDEEFWREAVRRLRWRVEHAERAPSSRRAEG